MTPRTRQLLLLGVLLVIGVIVVVAMRPSAPTSETTIGPSNRAGRPATAGRGEVPVVDVKMELLQRQRDPLTGPERNPFRFQPKAPPPSQVIARRAPPPQPVLPPQPEGPPPPPPILLRFIGFVEAVGNTGRVGMLSDGRGNVFYAKEGDIIEGRYRVLRIGTDSAELVYLDGRGRQTIRLSGQ